MGDEEDLETDENSVLKEYRLVHQRRKYFLHRDIRKRLGHPKDQLGCLQDFRGCGIGEVEASF